ncbi:MAG: hypothetical protein P8P29_03785 [Flavobacteriaceae bacterium]|nr:hypothetical protein [Flavobacteriaceae bacterium]
MNKLIATIAGVTMLTACTSAQDRREYRSAQVQVIGAQVSGRTEEGKADAAARAALYEAMAEVARNAPDSADAIAVALAISSVQEEADSPGAIVQLHREQNEVLEVAKVVAPALINTLGTVAVAGYQASVNKTQSDNAASVAIADSAANADVMRSVTQMATVGLGRDTVSVGGDYTTVGNDMDQSVTSTTSNSEAISSTNTESSSVSAVTDSNNQTTYTTTDGTNVSLEDIEALLGAGLRVTVIIDGEEVEVTQCEDTLTFGGGC